MMPVCSNENVISADLENVGLGHHLQESLYLGYYASDFNQAFIEMMLLWLTTKASHQLTLKV